MFFKNIIFISSVLFVVIAIFNFLLGIVTENEIEDEDICFMDNVKHKLGDSWSILGHCNTYECHGPNYVAALPCGALMVDEKTGCQITEMDLTKMYPDCCPQIECPVLD